METTDALSPGFSSNSQNAIPVANVPATAQPINDGLETGTQQVTVERKEVLGVSYWVHRKYGLGPDDGPATMMVEYKLGIMLVEQLTLAHFRIAKLQSEAGRVTAIEEVLVYNAAATRLLAEFRKLALALKEFRDCRVTQPNATETRTEAEWCKETAHNAKLG